MRILYLHANKIRMEAGAAGGTPSQQKRNERKLIQALGSALPALGKTNSIIETENATVALVYVEQGDEKLDLNKVKDDILRSRAIVGASQIVISAFGHLGDKPASPAIARGIIENLAKMVGKEYSNTQVAPFGWDKTFDIDVTGIEFELPRHHYNISHVILKPISENIWDEVAEQFDIYLLKTNHYMAQWQVLQTFQEHIIGNIVDIGCGAGRTLSYICSLPQKRWTGYIGVDSSKVMLELAERNNMINTMAHPNFEKRVKWIQTKIEDIKIHDDTDTVLLFNAICYIEVGQMLAKIKQLAPKRLIIADEDPFIPEFIGLCPTEIRKQLNARKHLTIGEIKQAVCKSGFIQTDEKRVRIDAKHELVGVVFELG